MIDVVIKGKCDEFLGFKENVILGKFVLVGIGIGCYCKLKFEVIKEIVEVIDEIINI